METNEVAINKTTKELLFELVEKVNAIDEKVDRLSRLEVLVKGDENYGARGLVEEVAELRVRVATLEKFRDRAIWVSIGMGAASGSGAWLMLQKLFGG